MSVDPNTIITGAHVALTIIKDLQKLVNVARDSGKELDLADVQAVLDKNIKAEAAWEESKAKKKAPANKKPAAKKAVSETPAEQVKD